jgi:hypothetical protein
MVSATRDMSRWPKWIVWAGFLLTVPVPFFLVVAIGLVPLSYILFLAVQGLIVDLQKFTADGFWITRLLFRFLSHRVAFSVVFVLIAALFVASAFEIYRLPHHNYQKPANIFRVIKDVSP